MKGYCDEMEPASHALFLWNTFARLGYRFKRKFYVKDNFKGFDHQTYRS